MLPDGLRARIEALYPRETIARVAVLADDAGADKAIGYGRPLRIELSSGRSLVYHVLRSDDFGHDRRADRVDNLVLAFDTFPAMPHHVRAVDVGLVRNDGELVSIADTAEPYLITTWGEGELYADQLRRIARSGNAHDADVEIAGQLATLLLEIHAQPGSHAAAYKRALRDLLGHGEGIFGLVDSYPDPSPQLRRIEEACLAWRWKLRGRAERLRRTHGDFHPFNIVVGDAGITLLDASRGFEGDPADDVACLAINYLFFGFVGNATASWRDSLGRLWDRFWTTYLAGDRVDVLAAVAPFFAWRALVLASPLWYPRLADADRARILAFAERVLAAERFDPAWGAETMAS